MTLTNKMKARACMMIEEKFPCNFPLQQISKDIIKNVFCLLDDEDEVESLVVDEFFTEVKCSRQKWTIIEAYCDPDDLDTKRASDCYSEFRDDLTIIIYRVL